MLRPAVLALALLAAPALAQQAPNRIIADQPTSPFAVKSFVADPGSAPVPGRRAGGGPLDRVNAMAEGYNVTGRSIEAVEVTVLAVDPFGELLGTTTEMAVATIAPEETGRVIAAVLTPDADTFHAAVVFVRRVRMAGGSVWEADLDPVLEALDQAGIDPAVLDE